jgi:chromosome segregation ATPase
LAQFAVAVEGHLARLSETIEALRQQLAEFDTVAEIKDKERNRKERLVRGYDKRARRLRVRETERILTDATQTRQREERQLHILAAAKALMQARVAQAELDALLDRLEELRREHRPELELVQQLGVALLHSWDRRLAELQADRELTAESIGAHEKDLEDLRESRVELTGRRARAESQRDQAQSAI